MNCVQWTFSVHTFSPFGLEGFQTDNPLGFFTISISDRKADRRSARQKNSGKINLPKKVASSGI